jgi:hypothetical protein
MRRRSKDFYSEPGIHAMEMIIGQVAFTMLALTKVKF